MLENARRAGRDRVRGAGGIVVIPPDWRARMRDKPGQGGRALLDRVRRSELLRHRPDPRELWRRRAELPELWARRRPDPDKLRALLRKHRVLLTGLVVTAVFAAGDTAYTGTITDRVPEADHVQRVAVAYPLQMQTTPPSVRRYLNAIANGERLREQAVVAAAARATLERAKAEAAAAAAGEYQPWMAGGTTPRPGAVLPGIGGFVMPARGVFTSGFGSRWGTFHNGIDIAGPIGTPIYAVANGTVIDAGPAEGFGLWVRIRHDDGSITVYGHMYDFFVSRGERVPAGMQIARMGNRGDSTGPHLHFEVIVGGQHVDPRQWLATHGLNFG
ncbi:peptidoglycan DD-metalloendopeptidase family protein [Nocardia brasiliensis]|uniref:Peptidoglycan DD-metalloendopeptidase family protein n=1 Tax=Nocardia brasiliensis TaxID=37326 RepID=A0A6G9XKL9_NOCBR|nr:M23 family metallopeptidase [Nocardia brasiliensis]QIS01457.1 peptidoglycan DD-metalloendopeptidase family protein [Nocardia brasiliensis]